MKSCSTWWEPSLSAAEGRCRIRCRERMCRKATCPCPDSRNLLRKRPLRPWSTVPLLSKCPARHRRESGELFGTGVLGHRSHPQQKARPGPSSTRFLRPHPRKRRRPLHSWQASGCQWALFSKPAKAKIGKSKRARKHLMASNIAKLAFFKFGLPCQRGQWDFPAIRPTEGNADGWGDQPAALCILSGHALGAVCVA